MTTLDDRITGRTTRSTLKRNSRAAQWRSSWALAIRMARRDSWRHKGRSLLVLVMIALPVLILTGGLTLLATKSVDAVEEIPGRMGSAQASVDYLTSDAVEQDPAGSGGMCRTGACPKAQPLPGGVTDTSPTPAVAKALGDLFHARVVSYASGGATTVVGEDRVSANEIFADAADPAFRGMVDLTSGRWAASPTEVVVTQSAARRGFPTSGTVELTERVATETETTTRYTIVGTATSAPGRDVGLVRGPAKTADQYAHLLVRDTPITWEEVQAANRYGVVTASRAVIENPPAVDQIRYSGPTGPDTTLVALLAAALFVISALLAGPAFAVIAQRQRHTLATAATNGATAKQLRRTVLGQALVLGVASSLVACALGIALSPVAIRVVDHYRPDTTWGPFDIPWGQLALVLLCAMVSAVTAALLPARGLGRLDVMAALRGDVSPRPPRRRLPVVGLTLGALGVASTWYAFERVTHGGPGGNATTAFIIAGPLLLVIGALLAVPMVLVGLARLTSSAPTAVRMAARDSSRQRGRATPTVAAVMAGAVLFGGLSIGFASYDSLLEKRYHPQAPLGVSLLQGIDSTDARALDQALRVVRDVAPGSRTAVLRTASTHPRTEQTQTTNTVTLVVAPGCTPEQAVSPTTDAVCRGFAVGDASSQDVPFIRVVDPAALDAAIPLPAGVRAALERGDVVTNTPGLAGQVRATRLTSPTDVPNGDPSLARWMAAGTVPVTVTPLPSSDIAHLSRYTEHVAFATEATVRRLGAQDIRLDTVVVAGDAPLTDAKRATIAKRLDATEDAVYTERGFVSPLRGLQWLLFGTVLALILVATLTATALSIGEAQRDLATLSAVGAPGRTRRWFAAAQAGLLALAGTAIGLVVGAIPGYQWSSYATSQYDAVGISDHVVIPWLPLLAMLVVVPLIAAALASLIARGTPQLQRRRG